MGVPVPLHGQPDTHEFGIGLKEGTSDKVVRAGVLGTIFCPKLVQQSGLHFGTRRAQRAGELGQRVGRVLLDNSQKLGEGGQQFGQFRRSCCVCGSSTFRGDSLQAMVQLSLKVCDRYVKAQYLGSESLRFSQFLGPRHPVLPDVCRHAVHY